MNTLPVFISWSGERSKIVAHAFRPIDADGLPPAYLITDKQLVRALVYMQLDIALNPSLAELAKYAHMSPFHFHRLFRKLVGVTPQYYQLQLQMHIAKRMLRTTRKPISRIAEETGFPSHGHFTCTFKRMFGQTPFDYREAN